MPRTFLITGVSSGLGRAFATGALEALQLVTEGRQAVDREVREWAPLSRSTGFPDADRG